MINNLPPNDFWGPEEPYISDLIYRLETTPVDSNKDELIIEALVFLLERVEKLSKHV